MYSGASRFSGGSTPPPSEDGSRCHSAEPPSEFSDDVNNTTTTTTSPALSPPPSPPRVRSQRDRLSLQREREANRSKQFTSRQRSASEASALLLNREGNRGKINLQQRQRHSISNNTGREEKPNEHVLVSMAYAEQQKWITVQQKTFTKWYVERCVLGQGQQG